MTARKLVWVGVYAVAMAYVESAVVVYLRQLFGIVDLWRDIPPYDPTISAIEIGREFATMVMLLAVGWLAGSTLQARLGSAAYAFGVWDIAYYGWLKVFIGWPASLVEWDFLFTIPVPWWGPVLAPALIALLMIAGGALAVVGAERGRGVRLSWAGGAALALGMLIVLYSFMAQALAALPATPETLSQLRPESFNWPVFLIGWGLMAGATLWATWPGAGKRP